MEAPKRPPYRPPIGIPTDNEGRWRGVLASSIFHLLIVFLIVVPVITMDVRDMRERRQATGLDAVGGGGGGSGGTGGVVEEIFYVNMGPDGSVMLPTPTVRPVTEPEAPPPEPVPEPEREPQPPPPPVTEVPPEPQQTSAVPPSSSDTGTAVSSPPSEIVGTGGGTGNDGSRGSGSGTGGGVGSGVGTGRGSGVGPGTGLAGTDSIYPPQLLTLALPPLQPPSRVRPYTLVALFDVDERGNTRLIGFNETRDGRFNRQLRAVLADVRFRPATLLDGTPVRDTGRFVIEYPP